MKWQYLCRLQNRVYSYLQCVAQRAYNNSRTCISDQVNNELLAYIYPQAGQNKAFIDPRLGKVAPAQAHV